MKQLASFSAELMTHNPPPGFIQSRSSYWFLWLCCAVTYVSIRSVLCDHRTCNYVLVIDEPPLHQTVCIFLPEQHAMPCMPFPYP